jgi:hypothetical protein
MPPVCMQWRRQDMPATAPSALKVSPAVRATRCHVGRDGETHPRQDCAPPTPAPPPLQPHPHERAQQAPLCKCMRVQVCSGHTNSHGAKRRHSIPLSLALKGREPFWGDNYLSKVTLLRTRHVPSSGWSRSCCRLMHSRPPPPAQVPPACHHHCCRHRCRCRQAPAPLPPASQGT